MGLCGAGYRSRGSLRTSPVTCAFVPPSSLPVANMGSFRFPSFRVSTVAKAMKAVLVVRVERHDGGDGGQR